MGSPSLNPDQQHPQGNRDRMIVDNLLKAQPNDLNLAELARLRIRYRGFPGARDIQADLEKVLQRWSLTEEQLFEITRAIHAKGEVYRLRDSDNEDWI